MGNTADYLYQNDQEAVPIKFDNGLTAKARSHWVLVRPNKASEISEGGIYLPETVRGTPRVGTVVSTGPGRTTEKGVIPITVKPGTKVIYGAFAGTPYDINDELLLLMREDEIILELEEKQ